MMTTKLSVFPKWLFIGLMSLVFLIGTSLIGLHYFEQFTNVEMQCSTEMISKAIYVNNLETLHSYLSIFLITSTLVLGGIGIKLYLLLRNCKENYNFYEAILDALPVPVFFKDLDGYYKYCNEAFYKGLGKEKMDIIGKRPRCIYKGLATEDTINRFIASDIRMIRDFEPQSNERTVNGKNVIVNKLVYRDYHDNVTGILGYGLDYNQIIDSINKEEK